MRNFQGEEGLSGPGSAGAEPAWLPPRAQGGAWMWERRMRVSQPHSLPLSLSPPPVDSTACSLPTESRFYYRCEKAEMPKGEVTGEDRFGCRASHLQQSQVGARWGGRVLPQEAKGASHRKPPSLAGWGSPDTLGQPSINVDLSSCCMEFLFVVCF